MVGQLQLWLLGLWPVPPVSWQVAQAEGMKALQKVPDPGGSSVARVLPFPIEGSQWVSPPDRALLPAGY